MISGGAGCAGLSALGIDGAPAAPGGPPANPLGLFSGLAEFLSVVQFEGEALEVSSGKLPVADKPFGNRVSSSLSGPVVPSFRALSGHRTSKVRRHQFN